MLRKLCSLIAGAFIAGLAGGISGIPAAQADVPETKDPIKLVIMGYSGDNIIMFILGDLLEKLGYNVENTPADYLGQFAGLKAGDRGLVVSALRQRRLSWSSRLEGPLGAAVRRGAVGRRDGPESALPERAY